MEMADKFFDKRILHARTMEFVDRETELNWSFIWHDVPNTSESISTDTLATFTNMDG